ncbi:MAG: DUF4215 domain-containing protein [Candidatus ainarchaeum sp.]|nr:DUF4215 domain-containing protein [Candidatus ainarchaeum sp.]
MNKGYFGIALIVLVVVGIFAFGFLSSFTAKDSYLFIPVVDHNKLKEVAKNNTITGRLPADLVTSKNCQSLEMQLLSSHKFVCKDFDESVLKKGTVTGYAKESFTYLPYGSSQKVDVNVGCEQKTDYCKSPEILYEAYCKKIYADSKKSGDVYLEYWPDYKVVDCNDQGPGYVCKSGACVDVSNICGNSIIDQNESCDDGNNKNGDGCSSKCLLEAAPDLIVSKIYKEPYSEDCVNSVHFEICNVGNLPVLGDFNILVKVEDKNTKITYSAGQYDGFEDGCVHITDSIMLSYGLFGLGLNENPTVEIMVDISNNIAETNEQNNSLSQETETGTKYLADGNICEETCTDSDDYLGEDSVYVKSLLFGMDSGGDYKDYDYCGSSGAYLEELICIPSEKGKKGTTEEYPCFLFNQICEDGKCVDAPGFSFSCDEQGDTGFDWDKKGKIIYIDSSGKNKESEDYCYNENVEEKLMYGTKVHEFLCAGPIAHNSNKNCICYDGACVGSQEDLCDSDLKKSCSKDDINYYEKGTAKQTLKLYCDLPVLGNTKVEENSAEFEDYCELNENGSSCDPSIPEYLNPNCYTYGPILKELSCNSEGEVDYLNYNCASEGKTCVNGACIEVGADPEECVDNDGINYFSQSYIWSKISIGWENNWWDTCLDDNTLLEYACDGNKAKYEKYDCSTINKVCNNGKCITPAGQSGSEVEELDGTKDNGIYTVNGKDYSLSEQFCIPSDKKIEYCDGQGNVFASSDSCVNDIGGKVESSNYLVSWSCDVDKPKTSLTNCNSNGGHCEINECVK